MAVIAEKILTALEESSNNVPPYREGWTTPTEVRAYAPKVTHFNTIKQLEALNKAGRAEKTFWHLKEYGLFYRPSKAGGPADSKGNIFDVPERGYEPPEGNPRGEPSPRGDYPTKPTDGPRGGDTSTPTGGILAQGGTGVPAPIPVDGVTRGVIQNLM